MSHSSRRQSSNTQPPAWRSLSTSKKRAPTSVSMVFAQPEQGKPLESAASKLPSAVLDDTASVSSKKRDRLESSKEVEGGATNGKRVRSDSAQLSPISVKGDAVSSVQEVSQAVDGPNDMALTESPKPLSVDSAAVPFPSTDTQDESSNAKPLRNRSSWFSSISRASGKEKKSFSSTKGRDKGEQHPPGAVSPPAVEGGGPPIQVQPATPQSEAELSTEPTKPDTSQGSSQLHPTRTQAGSDPGPDSTQPEPTPSEPLPIPSNRSKRPWFSSPTPSPSASQRPSPSTSHRAQSPSPSLPRSPTSPKPTRPRVYQTTSMPSSIDEEVPRVKTPTPCHDPTPAVVQLAESNAPIPKVSSLNPATSRFMLSIPMLGRPKVPLEKAVAAAQAEDVRAPGQVQAPLQTPIDEAIKAAQTQDVREESGGNDEIGEAQSIATTSTITMTKVAKDESATEREASSSSSWWGYVGLSGTPTNQSTESVQEGSQAKEPEVSINPPSPQEAPTISRTAPSASEVRNVVTDAEGAKPSSIFSADTARSHGSAWYSPWAWYGNPSGTDSKEDMSAGGKTDQKTESELVKEEALARMDSEPEPGDASAIKELEQKPAAEVNPIESSITTHRSGWMSFLASKALMMKTVSESEKEVERDENGVEVMNVEDEDEPKRDGGRQVVAAPQSPPLTPTTKDGPEPKKSGPPAAPITESESVKRETTRVGRDKVRKDSGARKPTAASPAPSKKSGTATPTSPRVQPPNLVLPTWTDTFHTPPRSVLPPPPASALKKTMKLMSAVGGALFATEDIGKGKGKGKGKSKERDRDREEFLQYGKELPRAWDVLGESTASEMMKKRKKVVVIGIHGWFPGAVMRTMLGEPTGTSSKFVSMMCQALDEFQDKHNLTFEKVTRIPLEGEGTINSRVEKLYKNLLANQEWMDDLVAADAIIVATHSQGSIVSTHLIDRLIQDGHIRTSRSIDVGLAGAPVSPGGMSPVVALQPQRVCCLALCGIHLGPLRYLNTSSLLQPYIQYFESAAARELFEFQDTDSQVSKDYVKALRNVTQHGTKMVYVASLNDQVVPIYSGLFTSVSHPLILRALYIDGDAYSSSDFMSNLLVLLIRVLNSGLSDSGLLVHLSEATAGSLSGVGHSTVYEELRTYSLAVDYLFLTNDGLDEHPELELRPFKANMELNDYEIPWSLRDLIADERVAYFFWREFAQLRDAFDDWHPKTTILRDIKKKLQPIQRLSTNLVNSSVSKL